MKVTIELDNGDVQVIEGYAAYVSVLHGEERDISTALVGSPDARDLISINAGVIHRTYMRVGKTAGMMVLHTAQAVVAAKMKEDEGGSGNVN